MNLPPELWLFVIFMSSAVAYMAYKVFKSEGTEEAKK